MNLMNYEIVIYECQHNESAAYLRHIQQYLAELLYVMAEQKNLQNVSYLTKDVHVWPDFHGNRSPLADPTLKGMVWTYISLRHFFDHF
jgi:ribulose kinase